jgi:hypothetical protein
MFGRKLGAIAFWFLLLASLGYACFSLGWHLSYRKDEKNLAFVSLTTLEPAVMVSDLEAKNPGGLPRQLVVSAEVAILMVASQSIFFAENPSGIPVDQRKILCTIAKNRDRHRSFAEFAGMYNDHLMKHLEFVASGQWCQQ